MLSVAHLNVIGVCEEHGEAVYAETPASGGWQAKLERSNKILVYHLSLIVARSFVLRGGNMRKHQSYFLSLYLTLPLTFCQPLLGFQSDPAARQGRSAQCMSYRPPSCTQKAQTEPFAQAWLDQSA